MAATSAQVTMHGLVAAEGLPVGVVACSDEDPDEVSCPPSPFGGTLDAGEIGDVIGVGAEPAGGGGAAIIAPKPTQS